MDYTEVFWNKAHELKIDIPFKGLAAAPIKSKEGQDYLEAMTASVNFAFANRQYITFEVRKAFSHFFKTKDSQLKLLYDVAHNIAKWESGSPESSWNKVQDDSGKYLVHRKGATRALPAKHFQNPKHYLETGHPAIVPGSMGSSSYVMVGLPDARETYYSVNHGAGRAMSRGEAKRTIRKEDFEQAMANTIYNKPFHTIADEAPQAYKDINLVVDTLVEAKIAAKVARLEPIAVIKGD